MSMALCSGCSGFVDTDDDPAFYDFTHKTNDFGGHCDSCRDRIYEEMTEAEQAEHERRIYG